MSTPATPSTPAPAGDNRKLAQGEATPIAPSFEDRLRLFWQRNSRVVTIGLGLVLLGIVAKGGWEYFQAEREKQIGQAYAAASTPAQLKAFAADYPDHILGASAQLRLADQAYSEGKYAEAIGLYESAAKALEIPALESRARLGLAMSKLQGGRTAEGEEALKALANDANEPKSFRATATYLLASQALAAGNQERLKTYSEQLVQIDPTSPWAQRVMMLRASLPGDPAAPTAPATDAPTIKLPGSK